MKAKYRKEVEQAEMTVFPIKGAVVMPELEETTLNGEKAYKFPKPNKEYRLGAFYDGMQLASKDGKKYVIAVHLER